jgi:hypothetical protein
MKFLNKYSFFARYIPGLISVLPLSLLYFFLTKKYTDFELREYFESATFLLGISATFILTFFVSMIVREFGSFLEKKYFNNRLEFPTNYLMLFRNDKLPKQVKERYNAKIKNDYSLNLLDEYTEEGNVKEALKILNQASRLLSTKYQQNEQVKEANISYGFSRNVSGGLFLSIPASVAGVITGYILRENSLTLWSLIAAIIFITLAFFHKQWIIRNAEKYAEKLISVYVGDL